MSIVWASKTLSDFILQYRPDDLDYEWHMTEVCKYLELVAAGKAPRLLVNHPRQYRRPRPLLLPDDD